MAGGYRAIDSLRVEKGYRVWGADITPDETPHEGGVGFTVKLDKDFLGREALREATPRKRLACITLEDPRSVALGNEPVRVGGEIAGRVTTGGYGYTVERSIAYAYLPPEHAEPGTAVELDIFGSGSRARSPSEPLFDPGGERVRGGGVSRPYDEAYDETASRAPTTPSCWPRSATPASWRRRSRGASTPAE